MPSDAGTRAPEEDGAGHSAAELLRALAVFSEAPEAEHERLGRLLGLPGRPEASDYTGLFVLQLYPYASVYLGGEGMMGGEARSRVAGFWRAVGRRPPPEPDHLASLLGLYSALLGNVEEEKARGGSGEGAGRATDPARRALRRQARKALLWEHLLSWLGPWLSKAREVAPPFYAAWADLLWETLLAEASSLGPPDALPLHLREAPGMTAPRGDGSGEGFLRALLAPARSGLILTPSDLGRAGTDLNLGVRKGERLYALRHLLAQDAERVLAWLTGEARGWADRHRDGWRAGGAASDPLGPVAGWWARRAGDTAELLEALKESA